MKFWLLKAAGTLEDEELILENSVITIGWAEFPDLSGIKNEVQVKKIMLEKYPGMKEEHSSAWAGEIHAFITKIKKGDLVAVPLKTRSEILIGKVTGEYEYRQLSNFISHIRSLRWLKTLPKGDFEEEYDIDLSSPETLSLIEERPEKLSGLTEIKTLGNLVEELNFALEDLNSLKERLLELTYRLAGTEEISEVRKIAAEMEKMLKEK
ncbi:restriction endonuclease [Methanosarcina sp.]|uniref:restriction endonuclease n=1 Tax=Methanosarcina sp. TaxID=2213 RepID=UPI003C74EF60